MDFLFVLFILKDRRNKYPAVGENDIHVLVPIIF
jgi:hypothetical protein